jgi:C-terminal processing protease CtpA/Prc
MTPQENHPLSLEDKLLGLSQFWRAVSYNFAYFDNVPHLDFDDAYRAYLTEVINSKDTYSYYLLLQRFCALLQDGHTNVYLPESLERELIGAPAFRVIEHNGHAVVSAVSNRLSNTLPLGSVNEKIDGMVFAQHVEANILPCTSSSTHHARKAAAYSKALHGLLHTTVELEFVTQKGYQQKLKFLREPLNSSEPLNTLAITATNRDDLVLELFESDITYLAVNSFQNKSVIDSFHQAFESMQHSKGIIIDLRFNSGGSTSVATAILAHFIDKPVQGATTRSRQHVANMKAYAQIIEHVDRLDLDEEGQQFLEQIQLSPHYAAWTTNEGEWLEPALHTKTDAPIYVLIGRNTASAAEDFLVYLHRVKHIKTVGEPSFGSTGQPLYGNLPGGGSFRVCTLKSTYPDGVEFNGRGVQPDIPFTPSLEQLLSEDDHTIRFALKALKNEIELIQEL